MPAQAETARIAVPATPRRWWPASRQGGRDPGAPSWLTLMVFLAPALVLYAGLTAYPVVRTFADSLYDLENMDAPRFIGLAHFLQIWSDETFLRAIRNTLVWSFIAPFLDVATGLLLALCLYAGVPFARFLRIAWFTPVLLSYVVVSILWLWIYNYDWGALNLALRAMGLDGWARAWLGESNTALAALMVTHAWKWAGFNMVVCLAALHALPSEVLEAAELDHCGWVAKLRHIIIPLMRPTLLNLYILAFIGKMKVFDLVWIMTQGGPMWSTETVSTYVYKRAFAWNTFDLGYPSAIAVVWFVIVLAAAALLHLAFRQREKLEY
ncbi:carbohydrate ABC transporter permease [Muricoccus aerilatus]|uniref:carbohydrate ABC transporter permease n=1 Tax=Muricoccus aerilatus TaxID=452982 RepID=UPI0005C14BAB|nr:sugar ABC transporter permease [Roseomonas aerilata]